MTAEQLQQSLFLHIKTLMPPHMSMVDEVASLLNISNDSAYRRIRGEKPITLDEVQVLAAHFKFSLDQFLHLESDSFIFNGRITNDSDFTYQRWLENTFMHVEYIRNAPAKHFYVLAKEIPFFYYFFIPEIAIFKSYFFTKTILHYEEMKHVKFSLDDDHLFTTTMAKKISGAYTLIPSTEIWHIENITSTLRQIEYYFVTGNFKTPAQAFVILDKLEDLLNHIEQQAETGKKFLYGQQPNSQSMEVNMYMNELIWGENLMLIDFKTIKLAYLNHTVINFISTRDQNFCEYMSGSFKTIIGKSIPLSGSNEKDRLLFLNRMRDKIKATRKVIGG
jgi:BetR domain